MNINSKFLLTLFFGIALFVTSACSSQLPRDETQPSKNVGLLWKIKKSEVSACYLLGTIHSEDKRVTKLPQPVQQAFDSSTSFGLEMLLDKKTAKVVLTSLYFTDGRTLKPLLNDDLYQRSIKAMEKKGLPEKIVNRMKPWAVFTVLSMPAQKTGLFLDAILFETAMKDGKNVVGLETPQEQTAVFDGMSLASQIALLQSTLDNFVDMNELQDEVIDVYLTRDLNKILALNEKYEAFIDEKLAKEFTQRLVLDRNHRMVKRMMPLLLKGNCFVAVGALHLPGDEGIINLLGQQGYEVRSVY